MFVVIGARRYKHGRNKEPLLQMGNHRSRYKNPFKGRNELTSRMLQNNLNLKMHCNYCPHYVTGQN